MDSTITLTTFKTIISTKMSSAANLQTSQYKKMETLVLNNSTTLPKRRRISLRSKKGSVFLTRCSMKPGIGSDSVASKNPAIEVDPDSTTQMPASPSIERGVPSKYSKGLVFGLGSEYSWDGGRIGSPVVKRYVGDDEERWYMWYHGRPAGEDGSDSIGLATSSNGVCWARGEEAVRSSGGVGKVVSCSSNWWGFDTRSVTPSDMVVMSSPMYSAVYWLYYTGCTDEEAELPDVGKVYKSLPGLACSQDGRNWARIEGDHHSGAVLDVGIGKEWDSLFIGYPKVVVHGENDLRMYYHSYDAEKGEYAIGMARSRDGIRWVKLGKIMGGGKQGSFDELGIANAHVLRQGREGKYLMAYEGVCRSGKRSIGMAESEDGLTNWIRIQDEPVLEPLEEEGWDSVAVCSPCLVHMEGNVDEWRLYYKGVGKQGRTGIGMAVSSGNDVTKFRRWQGFHL